MKTYTIQDVDIVLTMPDGTTEDFTLEAPNDAQNAFNFGFRRVSVLPNFNDGDLVSQRGHHFYQLLVNYSYDTHNMDTKRLQAAKKITLKFPPFLNSTANYQQADVILQREEVVKNYLEGFPYANSDGDIMPGGSDGLQFKGVNPYSETEVLEFEWGTRFSVTPDTIINIFFDNSGSMDATLAPLESMRDNLLKDELLEFYNDDESLYNQKVSVQNFSDERTFNVMQQGSETLPVINILFQDEAANVYHTSTFDSGTRTSQYETDITTFRSFLINQQNFRGAIYHVTSGQTNEPAFRDFLQAVEAGTGVYASPYGLSDRSQPQFFLDTENGQSAQYYMDLVMDFLTSPQ